MRKARYIVLSRSEWLYRRAMTMNSRCLNAMPMPDLIPLPDMAAAADRRRPFGAATLATVKDSPAAP